MATIHTVPAIDLGAYLDRNASAEAKAHVVDEVKAACTRYGFLQVKGHGVPLQLQRDVIEAARTLFALPQEQKDALSLKNSVSRRGYERIGEQTLDKQMLPDQKEVQRIRPWPLQYSSLTFRQGFYVGREVPAENISFMRGPNQWPDLREEAFHRPITEYHKHMGQLCNSLIEILVRGLGHPLHVLDAFTREPVCNLKLLHYPPHTSKNARQFGAGAHTDFGGITVLLQQPGKHGLQVYYQPTDEWLPVPAVEDVFVVNLGDLVHKWTDGLYRSTLHRVINAADGDRYSIPCFWHGDLSATNPFRPGDTRGETVEDHVKQKFDQSYGTKA